MILYFADRQLNIIGQASTHLPNVLTVTEDKKTEDVETGVAVFECKIPFDRKSRDAVQQYTEVGNYILRSQGGENEFYVDNLDDAQALEAILGSINMEKGIYDAQARFFAPYYRQLTLNAYTLDEAERLAYQDAAWQDVQDAFAYYLEHENNGRPFLIAGFSQGAELGLRLLKQYGGDAAFQEQLVAAYLIGWRVTAEDLAACPSLKMAQGEEDTGVIICFECEAESVTDTLVVPEGTFTYAINPLNWKTDSTPAAKEENLGFVYPGYDGSILEEIPQLCGAYLDPQRGTLKVTDIQPSEYPPVLDIFPEGSYHIYDYEFFYRNLQQNVSVRIQAYERARGAQ